MEDADSNRRRNVNATESEERLGWRLGTYGPRSQREKCNWRAISGYWRRGIGVGMRRKMRECRDVERGNGADGVGELEGFRFNVGMEFGRVGVGLEK